MLPKPRYLDLEEQLYSSITLHKELIFDNKQDGFHLELFEGVAYHSYDRVIDLTQPITHVIRKAYGIDSECQIFVYDSLVVGFRFLAYFPQENSITLGEQFLQADTLLFQIRQTSQQVQSEQSENEGAGVDLFEQNEQNQGAGPEEKTKRRKLIRQMLEVLEQWRKMSIQFNFKLSMEEAAEMFGIKKRTLQFYIHSVKLGEKNGYEFEANLQKPIGDLKKFLKEKSQSKKMQEMAMLAKFKNYYK